MPSSSHYIFYLTPATVCLPVHWVLHELAPHGVTFEPRLVDFSSKAQRDPSYLALNPLGRVPVLVIDNQPISECAAILLLLSERHPSANLAPTPTSPDRPKFIETMILLANSMLPAVRDWFYADSDGDPEGAKWVKAMAEKRMSDGFAVLNNQLEGNEFLVGGSVTAADYLAVCLARYSRVFSKPGLEWENVKALVKRMIQKPTWDEVNRLEGITGTWPLAL
jgi:glutathione S-transferase